MEPGTLLARVTQEGRPLRITTPLGGNALLLERIEGVEALSRLFRFRLDLLAEGRSPVDFAKVLGQPATVTLALPNGLERHWHGIFSRFSEGAPCTGPNGAVFTRYQAVLSPKVWLLTRRVQSRTHAGTVLDIVQNVLKGYDVDAKDVQGAFPRRDCCVQYQESDFAFVSRLLEEEGIFYSFTHEAERHCLVLGNTPAAHPEGSAWLGGAAAKVRNWRKSQEVPAGKWTLWDFCFETAEKNQGRDQVILDTVRVGAAQHSLRLDQAEQREIYEFPGGYGQRFTGIDSQGADNAAALNQIGDEAKRLARIRMEAAAAASLTVQARSRLRHLAAGQRFKLTQPAHAQCEIVLTQVRHLASQRGAYRSGGQAAFVYRNHYRGVPVGLPYRPPRRTPRPAIHGYQSAVVVCPRQQEVATDKHGRVKLQFHWDRQGRTNESPADGPLTLDYWKARTPAAESSSGWVRVAHPSAGQHWGQIVVPRIGQEVAVLFLDGDPDRPLVIGTLYNNINPPPFKLPEHALASGWKTHSAGGELDAFNGLAFNDTKGQENAQLQAQRNLILSAKQHLVTNVGGDWFENINGQRVQLTGALPALGRAGGDPKASSTDEPWQWTIGGLTSGIGKTATLTFGQSTNAVCGLAANIVFGCNASVTINPTSMFDGIAPNLSTLLAPVVGMIDGMNNISLGPMTSLTAGTSSNINLAEVVMVSLAKDDLAHIVLKNLCRALAIFSTMEVIAFGAVGDRLKENWMKDNAFSIAVTSLAFAQGVALSALALATLVSTQVVLYRSETMRTAATNLKNSFTNLSVVRFLADLKRFGDVMDGVELR